MKILMIMLSGVMLVNSQDMSKERLEVITGTQVVVQGKVPVVAKKATSKKATPTKKKTTKKKVVKKKTTKKKVKKKVKKTKKTKVKSYRVRYNVGEIQNYIHQLNNEYGWSEEDYYAWIMIVKRESSFNPYAVNKKSKATGLCQSLPARKMATHGSDYLTNYKTQARWCRDYIKNRYKTPSQAWSFWQSHHWF